MSAKRSRALVAVLVAALLGAALYLASTAGLRAVTSSQAVAATGPGSVPQFVYKPRDTVPTTGANGPVGPVSLVFAGDRVETGLTGTMANPWIAVSSRDGSYRALSAPHRPGPSRNAVAVAADGRQLAWGYSSGVVLYNPLDDTSREVGQELGDDPRVGRFSPDGHHLTVYDGRLRVLDVRTGKVAATLEGVDRKAAMQAVWTPDGSAVTYVAKGRLVIHAWRSEARVSSPTTIAPGAALAWQPAGKQLAALREARGVRSVQLFDVAGAGRLTPAGAVSRDGYAIQDLIGFTSDNRVAITALSMETGPLPLVYTMSTVDDSPPTQVMQLSGSGRWDTLQVAAEPLSYGSTPFKEPHWPAKDLSKLVGSIVVALFALGLYLTRRRRGGAASP